MEIINNFFDKNGLILAFFVIGAITYLSEALSKKVLNGKIPGSAIAILGGLALAYLGGVITGGQKGIGDLAIFKGFNLMGGSMFRDFAIIATAFGSSFIIMRKTGLVGLISLGLGILVSFFLGLLIAVAFGYHDSISLTTIGAGACTYIVGPVTGAAIGASSDVVAISIAAGVVKAIVVTIATPLFAKRLGLNNPQSAMIYGGLMGTNSGVAAGLAATDPKLVPYGAMTATFYTGLGCLLCPSILYLIIKAIFG